VSTVTRAAAPTAVPAAGVPAPPPLPDDLEALLRRLRLPHIRRHAPQVIATARAQRWEPAEVLRALLTEEACAVPKLARYSELAFPVPVRPLYKARSTTWRCCTAGGGP
jgi:hypothetical protein